jgi:hypothetical protein
VTDHHFLFALKVSNLPRFDAMLDDLAGCVLKHVGYPPAAIADILAELREAVEAGSAGGVGGCDVQFRAEAGQLLIVVSYADGREWRVARAFPD